MKHCVSQHVQSVCDGSGDPTSSSSSSTPFTSSLLRPLVASFFTAASSSSSTSSTSAFAPTAATHQLMSAAAVSCKHNDTPQSQPSSNHRSIEQHLRCMLQQQRMELCRAHSLAARANAAAAAGATAARLPTCVLQQLSQFTCNLYTACTSSTVPCWLQYFEPQTSSQQSSPLAVVAAYGAAASPPALAALVQSTVDALADVQASCRCAGALPRHACDVVLTHSST